MTAPIDNVQCCGQVTLNGMEWTARSAEDGGSIPEGTVVVVKAVDGVKLIVSPAGQEKTEG